jgi:Ser/Thr protein kinase RdoA (MazF antagonist)
LPARPIYAPAPDHLAQAIRSALGTRGAVFALANAGGSSATFRIDDQEPLFVKLVPPDRWRDLKETELIARWLLVQGAPAIAARDLNPPQLPTGEFVVAYPFAAGRPPQPRDVRALGLGLASLHAALGIHPQFANWQARTLRRMDELIAIRARITAGELSAGPQPDDLRSLAAVPSISFLPGAHGSGPARPLHGDLNIFNLVIDNETARFLDFEDVVHSVLSVENDVALLCERVVLVQEPDDATAALAIAEFLAAYAEAGGDPINRRALPGVLIGLSMRSLCTLAAIDPDGHDQAEWAKFFDLMTAATRRRAVFD